MLIAKATGRQVYTCPYIYEYAHIYTNHSKEYRTHRYAVHIHFTLQSMTLLIHDGVCMSYTATWEHLLALTQQANVVIKIQCGHLDVNVHRSTRNEKQGEYYSNDIYLYLYNYCLCIDTIPRKTVYTFTCLYNALFSVEIDQVLLIMPTYQIYPKSKLVSFPNHTL